MHLKKLKKLDGIGGTILINVYEVRFVAVVACHQSWLSLETAGVSAVSAEYLARLRVFCERAQTTNVPAADVRNSTKSGMDVWIVVPVPKNQVKSENSKG